MTTKAELISEIQAFYEIVGTPFENNSSDEHVPEDINPYSVIVYEVGLSEKTKKPVLNSKYINFIVYDEYGPGEAAYYIEDEPTNDVNKDFTGDDSLLSISKIFDSVQLRKRVRSAIMKAADSIFDESLPSSLLSASANTGQKLVNVVDGSIFVVGLSVTIADNVNSETNTIASISTNELTMLNNLSHTYTTGNDGYVAATNNDDRRLWAAHALTNPDQYTAAMTAFVALDSTVQSNGNSVSDSAIQTVVDNNVTKLATASNL